MFESQQFFHSCARSMAPRVTKTTRRRTLQIQGIGFPWIQSVLPLLPIPNSDENEEDKEEIQRRLQEPKVWNFFLTSFAWDFYKENRKRVAIVERCLINNGNPSTYVEDKGWVGLCNPMVRPHLLLIKESYANFTRVQGERRYIFVCGFMVEVSEEAIRSVLGLSEVDNDWQRDVASLPMKVDIWDFIKRVFCNNYKDFDCTLDKNGDPKHFPANYFKD
ncbi:OLC1v1000468C1 [Oldenlandia corymbosa var. corymbosa]|uniref:OLC1v1000468C1 n=1 Tax=Oldenlandia corymbosa var. corymbosa TaxID=529605 RepID=A0AAV1D313_OLDCO|nr:OLC1v1000468C1 [Oldenlandia corymbosa var. corymbosa]